MSVALLLAGLLALLLIAANLAYTAVSLACHRLRERRYPLHLPLGIPLLGSTLALAVAATMYAENGQAWIALLVLVDTGGPFGWLAALVWWRLQRPRGCAALPAPLQGLRRDRADGVR